MGRCSPSAWRHSQTVMRSRFLLALLLAFSEVLLPLCLTAQSTDPGISLGELARQLRREKPLPTHTVIDNDNFSQVMNSIETQRLGPNLLFSFNSLDKVFQVSSSPDVTCSLSFNANASPLLNSSYIPQDLPASELSKLDGPATINGDTLEMTVYNGSNWGLKEITIGLTILRKDAKDSSSGPVRLLPTVASDTPGAAPAAGSTEKRPDVTVLYHLKGSAAPFTTTVFREALGTQIGSGQDWHWAIVGAKGVPQPALGLGSGK